MHKKAAYKHDIDFEMFLVEIIDAYSC